MAAFDDAIQSTISRWHGIRPPNKPARRLAAELAETVTAFEALRGQIQFEDEPSSFESALQATKEQAGAPAAGEGVPPPAAKGAG